MSFSAQEMARDLGKKKTSINATATFLFFEPGLYTVNFGAPSSGTSDVGLRLPCARLEAVPTPGSGKAFITTVPDSGWLSTDTNAAHVLVVGGRAGALLTIYRSSEAVDMPVVEFRAVIKPQDFHGSASDLPGAGAGAKAAPYVDMSLTAHLQESGDRAVPSGEWCAGRGGRDLIEGFQIAASKDGQPIELEYQGFMGKDWLTQWFKPGQYCGSRGLQLPMLGFRIRLPERLAQQYSVQYWGVFGGTETVGPITDGSLCEFGQKPLTSMKIEIGPAQIAAGKAKRQGAATPVVAPPASTAPASKASAKAAPAKSARPPAGRAASARAKPAGKAAPVARAKTKTTPRTAKV